VVIRKLNAIGPKPRIQIVKQVGNCHKQSTLPRHRLTGKSRTAGWFGLPEAADIFFIASFSDQFETNETQLSYFPKY